ncbi:PDZ domain-containing protein [Paraburkholderia sp. BCC1885]|uniref:PDZ domain-containing protein n=1 Tax=Paraburkholderia sp. BCC1885 TaxID=2562669 RepID=UPI001181F11C|nr:PDZ domain-containing protein [Paraburkholderia sp. BCC1885]
MLKRAVLCAFVPAILAGCANPYAQYYNDRTGGIDITKATGVIVSDTPPVIIRGSDPETDYQTMFGDGFRLLGYSSFNGKEGREYQVKQQAEAVKAVRVLLYEKYSGAEQTAVPLTLPNTASATTNFYGSGGYGTATTTMTGSTTTMVPISVRRYDQMATFWIRAKPNPVLGIDIRDLTPQQRAILQTNKGVTVNAVQKDTPAYDADLLKGDILKSVGSIEVTDGRELQQLLQKFAGQKVKVEFIRDGKLVSKDIKLNPIQ